MSYLIEIFGKQLDVMIELLDQKIGMPQYADVEQDMRDLLVKLEEIKTTEWWKK